MANVLNVAAYVVSKCAPMTTMKLQKLVYYCQAWSLAWDDVPLFDEDFEAWANGPVCPRLFQKHKGLYTVGKEFLTSHLNYEFDTEQKDTMDAVIRDLGDKAPQWLSDLTHSEQPWLAARKGCAPGENCSNIIDKTAMQSYYGSL